MGKKLAVATTIAVAGLTGAGLGLWRFSQTGQRTVQATEPNLTELLRAKAGRIDWADGWVTSIAAGETRDPVEWAQAIFDMPPLVKGLMRLRDRLVRRLGLQTVTDQELPDTFFPLLAQTPSELVLGFKDKHLDFCVGLTIADGRVWLTTTVQFNNWFGRLYFIPVRLIHPLIVKACIQQANFVR
jgi:hypothetical protein